MQGVIRNGSLLPCIDYCLLAYKCMKEFFKTLIFALAIALTGTRENVQAVTCTIEIAQTQKAVDNKPIPLTLSTIAVVALKNGSSMTGQVTAFDSKGQTIQISGDGVSHSLQIVQIEQVTFKQNGLFYTSDDRKLIRGEDHSQAKQMTWGGIPLNAFQLPNPKRGQASVDLSTVMNANELCGIQSVAKDNLYIVDEIEFKPAGKIIIKVTAIDRPTGS